MYGVQQVRPLVSRDHLCPVRKTGERDAVGDEEEEREQKRRRPDEDRKTEEDAILEGLGFDEQSSHAHAEPAGGDTSKAMGQAEAAHDSPCADEVPEASPPQVARDPGAPLEGGSRGA